MVLDKLTNKFDFMEIEFLAWDKMTQFEDDDFVFVVLFFYLKYYLLHFELLS